MPDSSSRLEYLPRGQRQRLLLRLLRQPGAKHLQRLLAKVHPADIAALFPLLRPDERLRLLEALFEMGRAAATLKELDTDTQREVLADFPDDRLAVVLARLPADDAVDLLEELDSERREALLGTLEESLATRLHNLLWFGPDTAGGLMNPEVVCFRADQSVARTIDALREMTERQRLFYLYVTDDRGHLIGLVNLWRLLTAEGELRLRDVMRRNVVSVQVDAKQEEVARVFSSYDLLMVPVTDEDGCLVGAITVDDIIDVIEEEASSDLSRLGNLPAEEGLATPILRSLRLRLPWLVATLVTALLAAGVVSLYQTTITQYAILAAFMTVVAGTGGQAGTQTLTILLGALSADEIGLRHPWGVIGRQVFLGALNGLAAGAVLAGVAWVFERNLHLSAALCVAQCANFVLAATLGASLPLVLRKLGLDPALGSSLAVTTIADVGGFAIFLGLASRWIEAAA